MQALPCSSVILSGTLSTGAAGRHFSSVAWRFGTADVATGGLEAWACSEAPVGYDAIHLLVCIGKAFFLGRGLGEGGLPFWRTSPDQ